MSLLVVRWQSFGSPPEAPGVLVPLDGLPALLVEPVVLVSVPEPLVPLPFMLLPVPLLLPLVVPVPEVPLPEVPLPDVPEDCAMAEVASVSASAEVARIFKSIGFAFLSDVGNRGFNLKALQMFRFFCGLAQNLRCRTKEERCRCSLRQFLTDKLVSPLG